MRADDDGHESFDERVRSIAREFSRSLERAAQVDLDDVTEAIGVDPVRARELVNDAVGWLRAQAQSPHNDAAFWEAGSSDHTTAEDQLGTAGPHPLDLPTDQQGMALAAFDSGRWTVQPGSHALVTDGAGPQDGDALQLVDELRGRDWIGADGELTLAGRHALRRWLDAGSDRRSV